MAIIQRRLTHYRVPLFETLRVQLAAQGIRFRLLHGDASGPERCKDDSGHLAWAEHLPTHYFLHGHLCWQPFWRQVEDCDLVVMTQENKLLNNLPMLLHRPAKAPLLAFWGHGENMQARRKDCATERFKRWTSHRVDWWFAYTSLSAGLVEAAGFPSNRMTILNNSVDTARLRLQIDQATRRSRAELRAQFGLGPGPLGVFIGSLYAEKRIPFLLQAALKIRALIPGFQLVMAGTGPERAAVEQAAAASGGVICFVGAVHEEAKASLLACANIMLNPGLVGLGILDAFIAGLPIATTDCGLHSPEIAYLEHRRNGFMTANSMDAFVHDVAAALSDTESLERMGAAALASADRYTLAAMAENFTTGIRACLAERAQV